MSIINLGTKLDRQIYRDTYRETVCKGCPMNKWNYPELLDMPSYWSCWHVVGIRNNRCDQRPASSLPWGPIWADGWE